MNKFWKWFFALLGAFIVVFLLAFLAFGFFGGRLGHARFYTPMMGRDFRNLPMMPHMGIPGGFNSGLGVFGWAGMIFSWLLRLGFIALVVAGIVWLVRNLTQSKPPVQPVQYIVPAVTVAPVPPVPPVAPVAPVSPTSACGSCGKPAQADWKLCPYCGAPLSGSNQ